MNICKDNGKVYLLLDSVTLNGVAASADKKEIKKFHKRFKKLDLIFTFINITDKTSKHTRDYIDNIMLESVYNTSTGTSDSYPIGICDNILQDIVDLTANTMESVVHIIRLFEYLNIPDKEKIFLKFMEFAKMYQDDVYYWIFDEANGQYYEEPINESVLAERIFINDLQMMRGEK